jgi:aldehyde dehydrogenase
MRYPRPNTLPSSIQLKARYDNYIGGKFTPAHKGGYFENRSPVTGEVYTDIARSDATDVDLALDAAHAAFPAWSKTSVQERSNVLLAIADRIETHLEPLAIVETWDNGKAIRETLNADLPLVVDHFRYFAGCLRAEEGSLSEIDSDTLCLHRQEPIGVVGQIIPWNFPLLMAAWKLAPALAAGCTLVLKPAEQTPVSIMVLMELIEDLIPPGVVNIVNGYGLEAGKMLSHSKRIAKLAFTGSTAVGRDIMRAAAENLIPATIELGGKSPNLFFADILDQEDTFINKAVEGMLMTFFNQGEVCTCPSRALVQASAYEPLMELVLARASQITQGDPLDTDSMIGAQASAEQLEKIQSYLDLGLKEGAQLLIGGQQSKMSGDLVGGYYLEPTIFKGQNHMRIFQEEIFGPTLGVTTFKDEQEALVIANDTQYGLGAGLWTKDIDRIHRISQQIQAGRLWVNCYHQYPAHAAFGGYKASGIGRETHKMTLKHYQQTKNVLISHQNQPVGLF